MKRCFGYVRVSTQKQGEGVSLEAQRDAILAYASKHSLAVIRWFEELETAARTGRPEFSAMVRALRAKKADGVIIHKIDRSARNIADWAKVGELSDEGIDIHFVTETLDFRSRGGRLTADIQAVIAADYIRNLREETVKGMRGRLKQGLWPWKAPPGYLDAGRGQLKIIDPIVAPFVRRLFELYATGAYSLFSLGKHVAHQAKLPELSRLIQPSMLSYLLSNPFYCGILLLRGTGERFPGHHEPLISVELFQEVQAVRNGRTSHKVHRHSFSFPGLFKCGTCGRVMVGERQKGHNYYRCHTRGCDTKSVREERLDEAIRRTLGNSALSVGDESKIIEHFAEVMQGDRTRELRQSAEVRLNIAQTRLSRLTDLYLDGRVLGETYDQKRGALVEDIARVRQQQVDLDRMSFSKADLAEFIGLVRCLSAHYDMCPQFERLQLAKIASSNCVVRGKYVVVEPSEWLRAVTDPTPLPSWLPNSIHSSNAVTAAENVLRILRSPETQQLREILKPANDKRKQRPRDADGRFHRASYLA